METVLDVRLRNTPLDDAETFRPLASTQDPTAEIPVDIFETAMQIYLNCRRLDMGELASQLKISRATLYRRVKHRDQLLGAIIWQLMQRIFETALEESKDLSGIERIEAASRNFMMIVNAQKPFRHWLDNEPEIALRILTSKNGPIQGSVVAIMERILGEEVDKGNIVLSMDRHMLAYAIVRIGETFLYADVIADNESDVELATKLIGRLVRG